MTNAIDLHVFSDEQPEPIEAIKTTHQPAAKASWDGQWCDFRPLSLLEAARASSHHPSAKQLFRRSETPSSVWTSV